MTRQGESPNPYAPPAPSVKDPDLARLIAFLPSRRRAFDTILSIGGIAFTLGGIWALAVTWEPAAGKAITSPLFGIAVATLGLGVPLALLGALLAVQVRLVQFVAFPLTCVCGGIGGVGLAIALVRANLTWAPDDLGRTLVLLTPIVAYLASAVATGYVFHRTVMTLTRAGVNFDAKR